jgi:hypothetical protein
MKVLKTEKKGKCLNTLERWIANEQRMHRHPQPDIQDDTGSKQQIATKSHYKGGTSPPQQAFKNKTGNEEQEGAHTTHQAQ